MTSTPSPSVPADLASGGRAAPAETNSPNLRDGGDGTVRAGVDASVRGFERRSVRGRNPRIFPPGDKLTTESVTKTVTAVLGDFAAKEIVSATGGSIRAAENVRQGLNAMSLTHFLNACRSIPELRAAAMEMMGCEAETDPEFVRGISLLMNSYARKKAEE